MTSPATPTTASTATAAATAPATFASGATRPDVEHFERPLLKTRYVEADALALRQAWGIYLLCAVLPPLVMIGTIFYIIFAGDGLFGPSVAEERTNAGWAWFIGGMIWIGLSLPLAFYIRRGFWARFYAGGVVGPRNYLKGNLVIWAPLVIGGIIGFIGFAATLFAASIFTSVMAFIIFLAMFPNGHAMTRAVGDHDDPGVYEEPR